MLEPVVPTELVEPLFTPFAGRRTERRSSAVGDADRAGRDLWRKPRGRLAAREVTVVGVTRQAGLDELVEHLVPLPIAGGLPGAAEAGVRLHDARASAAARSGGSGDATSIAAPVIGWSNASRAA